MKKNKTNNKIIIYSAASMTLNGFIAFQIIPEKLIPIIRSSEIISIVVEPASRVVTKINFKLVTPLGIIFIIIVLFQPVPYSISKMLLNLV
jgi:hypothetical protein